jgi:Outer membrane protein and related peptidoglycan-associated (lipo)proteins
MSHFFDSLKNVITTDRVRIAAEVVEEKPEKVQKAINSIIAGLLGIYEKEHNPKLNNILRTAGNLNFLKDFDITAKAEPTEEQTRVNNEFQQALLGDKAIDFATPIAEDTGITTVVANRLTSVMSALVAGYLGEKLTKENWTESRLLTELKNSQKDYVEYIPNGLIKTFGLSFPSKTTSTTPPVPEKKKSYAWVFWLILIALLILLAVYGWKSCRDDKTVEKVEETVEQVIHPEKPTTHKITLSDGKVLTVAADGIEYKLYEFLSSGNYDKASAEELKYNWFEFKDVDFEFNSASKLKEGSLAELDNISAILKSFPNAKIMIAGFADKVGSEEVNMEISKERAKTIEKLLDERGLTKQIVKVEGYGERYAKHAEKDSDEKRAEDRDFALRFVK